VAPDIFRDVVAERADFRGEALARFDFLAGELGIAMKMLEQRAQSVTVIGSNVAAQLVVGCMDIDGGG